MLSQAEVAFTVYGRPREDRSTDPIANSAIATGELEDRIVPGRLIPPTAAEVATSVAGLGLLGVLTVLQVPNAVEAVEAVREGEVSVELAAVNVTVAGLFVVATGLAAKLLLDQLRDCRISRR